MKTGREYYIRTQAWVKPHLKCAVGGRQVAQLCCVHARGEGEHECTCVRVGACTVVKPDLHCAKTTCEFQDEAGRRMTADTAFYPAPAGRQAPGAEYSRRASLQESGSLSFQSKRMRDPHINSNHQWMSAWMALGFTASFRHTFGGFLFFFSLRCQQLQKIRSNSSLFPTSGDPAAGPGLRTEV